MIKRTTLLALLLLPFSWAMASSPLERIESISEDMTALMFDAMIEEMGAQGIDTDQLRELIPDTDWDQPMRDAGSCVIDQFTAKIGEDGVNTMLDNMEARLPEIQNGGMDALEDMPTLLPEGISEEEADAISNQCGMTQLMQQKMMNPDFMSAVMSLMSQN